MDFENVVRVINVILAFAGIVLLLRKAFLYWDKYQTRTRDYWWVLFAWCLAVMFGNIAILTGFGSALRAVFTFFALILTIKVLAQPNEVDNPVVTKEF